MEPRPRDSSIDKMKVHLHLESTSHLQHFLMGFIRLEYLKSPEPYTSVATPSTITLFSDIASRIDSPNTGCAHYPRIVSDLRGWKLPIRYYKLLLNSFCIICFLTGLGTALGEELRGIVNRVADSWLVQAASAHDIRFLAFIAILSSNLRDAVF